MTNEGKKLMLNGEEIGPMESSICYYAPGQPYQETFFKIKKDKPYSVHTLKSGEQCITDLPTGTIVEIMDDGIKVNKPVSSELLEGNDG